jgi:hypothetical protein
MAKFVKGKDGKFEGSIGDGKSQVPTAAPLAPGLRSWEIPGAEEFARAYESTYQTYLRMTQPHPEDRNPGTHPDFGGHNWGVAYSPEWNDWSINHGYYGSFDTHDNGDVYVDGSDTPLPATTTRWTADAKTQEFANLIWEHRDQITEGLVSQGYSPNRSVRIAVKIDSTAGTLGAYPYDYADEFKPFTIAL